MAIQEVNYINSIDVNISDATPAMQQYLELKQEHQDKILLYRMGDFYETFFEDAVRMSKELEITLTARDCGSVIGKIPLAGIPAKAVEVYLEKLVKKGIKVAICEQLEDPKFAKGIVKRGITRIVTAGTITESNLLDKNKNNYICAMFSDEKSDLYGFAYTDISTGEFKVTQASYNLVVSELARIRPSEIIAPAAQQKILPFQIVPEQKVDLPDEITANYNCSMLPQNVFEENFAKNNLKAALKIQTLDGLGFDDCKLGFRAAAALLGYIWETLKENFPKFETIESYILSEYVLIDSSTRKNLELVETLREKNKYGSLLWALDKTKTNMGARLLRSWICQPLKDVELIKKRQDFVSELINLEEIRLSLAESLEQIYDIQRLATRLSNGSVSPKDFVSLKASLQRVPEILEAVSVIDTDLFNDVRSFAPELADFADIIDRTIQENPPMLLKEGGIIKEGVSGELDYLNDLLTGGENWLRNFEEQEKERTGIKNLKIGFNKVFGYFIEVTNSNLNLVPETYIRKQTLTGGERYITEDLKKHEDEVLNAQFKARELEYKLFCDFKDYAKEFVSKVRILAENIAKLDVLNSFATAALENNYSRPVVDESNDFIVKNGRHPVLELILPLGEYVSNDLELCANSLDKTQFMILTGPNMAGKSTFMRQNALIALMAQIGSYVPADSAKIGVVDKIFTRVGASDDLTLGQSTFMVEMVETAYILNSATEKSLILLDEIGRGTSTYDGVAIAWAVAEYIVQNIKARCIFATHYHELNVMTQSYPQIKNYRITITEKDGNIIFLRKIVQGGASKSYGIQVAKMAGLPSVVLERSTELMNKLQKNQVKKISAKKSVEPEVDVPQLNLF